MLTFREVCDKCNLYSNAIYTFEYVGTENIPAHTKDGHWKFWRGGGSHSQILKGKYETKPWNSRGEGVQTK